MYQFSYSEILADNPIDSRAQERAALDTAIDLLHAAAAGEPHSAKELEALTFTTQLWGIFIKDLADPGNDLPSELRGRLMSIGLWIMSEAQRIIAGQSRDLLAIAEVCGTIRAGLS